MKLDATGLAALITAVSSGILGLLAYMSGRKKGDDKKDDALEPWKVLVEQLQEERNALIDERRELREELERERKDHRACRRRLARYDAVSDKE